MNTAPSLIERILPEAGIVSAHWRRDVERELAAHLEDVYAELDAGGRGEHEIESCVAHRFGNPAEIARGFARVYRAERLALYAAGFAALAVVSWGASASLVAAVQFVLALGLGFSPSRLFAAPHLVWETVQIAALTLGCLGIYFSERLFGRWRLAKAAAAIGAVFAVAAGGLELASPGHGRVLLVAFLCAVLVRALQAAAPRRLLLAAGAALFAGMGLAAAHAPAQTLFAAVWVALAASCQFTTMLAGAFERHILRRHSA